MEVAVMADEDDVKDLMLLRNSGEEVEDDEEIVAGSTSGNAPPPPLPPPPPGGKANSKPFPKMRLKSKDKVNLETLRSGKAGEKLWTENHPKWNAPIHYADGQWIAGSRKPSLKPSQTTAQLKIVSYNVLFSNHCCGHQRVPVILSILEKHDADIIVLAEVIEDFLKVLLAQKWVQQRYSISDSLPSATVRPYGQLILSKYPFEKLTFHELPSRNVRRVVIGQFQIAGHLVAVAATHLDSPPRDGPLRITQLDAIFRALKLSGAAENCIIAGDFNFADNTNETNHLAAQYPEIVDVWKALKKDDPGHTFSVTQNEMTVTLFPGEKDKRLDRILLGTARQDSLRPLSVEIDGTQPIRDSNGVKLRYKNGALFPSDHFALAATFSIIATAGSSGNHSVSTSEKEKDEKCTTM